MAIRTGIGRVTVKRMSISAMNTRNVLFAAISVVSFSALGACTHPVDAQSSQPSSATIHAATASSPDASLPVMLVHKSATCGCCGAWVDHMRAAGFNVDVRDVDDLDSVKSRVGIPFGKGSCHTAEVGGYFVEGHVPALDIKRLLAEKPDAKGLVVPGMPAGSPGMEMPDGRVQPYVVELVSRDGTTSDFAHHGH